MNAFSFYVVCAPSEKLFPTEWTGTEWNGLQDGNLLYQFDGNI